MRNLSETALNPERNLARTLPQARFSKFRYLQLTSIEIWAKFVPKASFSYKTASVAPELFESEVARIQGPFSWLNVFLIAPCAVVQKKGTLSRRC